jgi:phospholipid/cholesterol/gamma-HCH transport system substrate-binding protein
MPDKSRALTWTELRVGVVVVLSLTILAVTVLYIGGGGGSPVAAKYELRALMTDVNGLKPGAPVRLGGVEVGTVTDVGFSDRFPGQVEVKMKLQRDVQSRITSASRMTLGSLGLLGEKAVDITPGTEGTPIGDGGYLRAEAQDPFKGLLGDASESTEHLRRILSRIDAGEGLIGKALRDDELYDRMNDVSARLQVVMTKLESPSTPLGRLVNDREMSRQLADTARGVDAVVARVQAGEGTLGVLTKDESIAREMKSVSSTLDELAKKLQRGEGSAGKLLKDDEFYRKLNNAADRFDAFMQRLEHGEGTAGRMARDPELYNNLNSAAKEMRALVEDVRKDPRKYLRVKVSLF